MFYIGAVVRIGGGRYSASDLDCLSRRHEHVGVAAGVKHRYSNNRSVGMKKVLWKTQNQTHIVVLCSFR